MEKQQIEEKLKELETKVSVQQEEKDKLIQEIGVSETAIKISQSKIIDIDETILSTKSEIIKYKNCLEILER